MTKVLWPSWRYGPQGQSGIFESDEDVPIGWYAYEDRHLIQEPGDPPPPDGPDAHGGIVKDALVQMLRASGQKIYANMTPRQMHAKLVLLGKLEAPKD